MSMQPATNHIFMNKIFTLGFALGMMLVSHSATADISVSPKHLWILRSGIEMVYGSYIFAVENDGDTPQELAFEVALPHEVVDFQIQEGMTNDDVALSEGHLKINKVFNPGVNVVSIGFKAPANNKKAILTLTPPQLISELTILIPSSDEYIQIESPEFRLLDENAPGGNYRAFVSTTAIGPDQDDGGVESMRVVVGGVAEGRLRLWIIGGVFGFLLVSAGAFFAFRTSPNLGRSTATSDAFLSI